MLLVPLTKQQTAVLAKGRGKRVVAIALTDAQYRTIRQRFPALAVKRANLTVGAVAAPFIPGGAVVSASISGLSQSKEAVGSVASSGGG
jgi:hypothetical protein